MYSNLHPHNWRRHVKRPGSRAFLLPRIWASSSHERGGAAVQSTATSRQANRDLSLLSAAPALRRGHLASGSAPSAGAGYSVLQNDDKRNRYKRGKLRRRTSV